MVKVASSLHLALFLLFCLIFINASSLPSQDPLPFLSLRIKPNKTESSSCSYRVEIKTSCASVPYTTDKVSLSFGDAKGNQVYVERIDDPSSRTFEACSTDTFDLYGPCTYDVCYVYLYRSGKDGLNVGNVRISGKSTRTVTFTYNKWIPSSTWYGFNYCNGASSQGYKHLYWSDYCRSVFHVGLALVLKHNTIVGSYYGLTFFHELCLLVVTGCTLTMSCIFFLSVYYVYSD